MYTPDEIFSAANAIGPELPQLLGDEADAFQQQLTTLLQQDQSTPGLDNQLLKLLGQHEATRTWTKSFLDEEEDTNIVEKGFKPTGSSKSSNSISAPTFACPVTGCNETWTRQSVGEEVPLCPVHQVQLERVSA